MSEVLDLELKTTEGEGGGKGGGGGGSESADTLQTNEVVKLLHLIGEGEINLYTNDGQSIFLNNTPLQNSDLSYNYGAFDQASGTTGLYRGGGSTYYEWRSGAPTQSPMTNPAFPSASAVYVVNQQVLGGTSIPSVAPAPVTYSVTAANIDYAKVAINFPQGLVSADSNGNITGDSVYMSIDVKPRMSGTWTNALTRYINDKSDNPATIQFQVANPNPGSLWDIRVNRLTEDNSTATRKNEFSVFEVEEVQKVTLPYNGIALCGLALDAATIGGANTSIPSMSFLVSRGPIAIPSNYNPTTWTFTGSWDGTFTTGVTDDPAWVLWDMLTNQQYGCYLYGIRAANIDKYSFYNASVFNNAQVTNGHGGYEPRFTFNAPIQNRQDMLVSLQQVATMMNASIGVVNGLITIFQDRPVNPKYLINKSRVIGSDPVNPVYFKYASNQLTTRYTSVNITWVNATNIQYLPTTTSVADATGLSRYGYQPTDISAFGATTYGQAHRAGKYWMYEQLYNTETVEFDMGLEGMILQPDDVFDLFDDDYAGRAVGGRTVSATASSITLDQPVTIDPSVTSYLYVLLQDGVTFEKHTITNTAGTYSTLNISGTFSTTPTQYTPWGVQSAIAPRTFKIKNIKIDGATKVATISARLYSNLNYTYAEGTYTAPTAVYTQPTLLAPAAPTNLIATPTTFIDPNDKLLTRGVTIHWDRPASQNTSYVVKWRKDNGQYHTSAQFQTNTYELHPIVSGVYDFLVYSVNVVGRQSTPASISYTLNTAGGASSATLTEITNLQIVGSGGTTWTGVDCNFQWTNPAANQGLLKDFVVTIKTTGGSLLRQVIVDPVIGGATQHFIYHFTDNAADGLNRSIAVTVQGRDSQNNTTTGITQTLTNAAPAVPGNIAAVDGLQNVIVTWTPDTDTDLAGYIIWWSTSNGFTPGSGNATDLGNVALASFNNLLKNTTYYYRIAAYDLFSKSLAGTGLNVSPQQSTATPSHIGVPSGSSLPGSATQGDLFYLTSDNTMYRYTGSAWTNATDGSTITPASITTSQIAAGTILAANIAAGTITGANIAATTIAASNIIAGTLTATQIAASTITGAKIAATTITGSNLVANTITASQIAASTITTTQIAAATIQGGDIAASTITASNLTISSLSAINANVGTLTAGTISNNSGTNVINLSATGASLFINTPGFTVDATGNMNINQLNVIDTINIANNAVTVSSQVTQSTIYSFTATANANTNVDNPNCSMTITLAHAGVVMILCSGTIGMDDGSGFTYANFPGDTVVTPVGDGASGLVKVDSTYYSMFSGGVVIVSLAVGSHTIKMAGNFDTTASASADACKMKNGQLVAVQFLK